MLAINRSATSGYLLQVNQEPLLIDSDFNRLNSFVTRMNDAGLGNSYEVAHARLILAARAAAHSMSLPPLPEKSKQAATQLYHDTSEKLMKGFESMIANADGRATEIWKASR